VRGGVLTGRWLFVRDRNFFGQMVAGEHDAYLFNYLQNVDLRGQLICDLGAHIGYHSMAFAELTGEQGRVLAFEPNPFNLERLRIHLRRNGDLAERIEVMPVALSDRSGVTTFHYSARVDDATSSGGYLDEGESPLTAGIYRRAGFQQCEVATTTLDEVLPGDGARSVALIKIDVEGAECLVLDGGRRLIQRDRPLLLIEVHSVAAMLGLAQRLPGLGYTLEPLEIASSSRCFVVAAPQ
jgi:FkbM family methyltransferase